jgi:hypothetical protein
MPVFRSHQEEANMLWEFQKHLSATKLVPETNSNTNTHGSRQDLFFADVREMFYQFNELRISTLNIHQWDHLHTEICFCTFILI